MKKIFALILFLFPIFLFSQKITDVDVIKYLKAYDLIKTDSINRTGSVRVSDMIIDLDRFYFRDFEEFKNAPELLLTLDSLVKFNWFEDFSFSKFNCLFNNKYNSKSIVFFSLIEKNTLRADLFTNGLGLNNYDEIIKKNKDKVYAYIFFFNEEGNIIKHIRKEIHYEPF